MHFQRFVATLGERLHIRKVDPVWLRDFVLTLKAFKDDEREVKLMTGPKLNAAIRNATGIMDILEVLQSKCASFFHYQIFQLIKEKYCEDDESPDLNYELSFETFVRQPMQLSKFFETVHLKKDFIADLSELTVQLDSINLSNKLIDIVDLRDNLAKALGLRNIALQLVGVEEGRATFMIPAFVAKCLFHENELRDAEEGGSIPAIKWLKYGDRELDISRKCK